MGKGIYFVRPISGFCLSLPLLIVLASHARAEQRDIEYLQTKPPISEQEFFHQFTDKKVGKGQISNRSIPAKAIIELLQWAQDEVAAGHAANLPESLRITNSVIIGGLDFKELRRTAFDALPPEVQQKYDSHDKVVVIPIGIQIDNSVFHEDGEVKGEDFRRVVFSEFASFSGSTFETGVSFDESLFQGQATFDGTIFKADASFEGATFDYPDDRTTFDEAQFLERARFILATFNFGITFEHTQFKNRADFAAAAFKSFVRFDAAVFQEIVSFDRAQLGGQVIFDKNDFPANVFFTNINDNNTEVEKGELIFTSVNFRGRAYFSDSRLKGIWFSFRPGHGVPSQFTMHRLGEDPNKPVIFEKYAAFRKLTCVNAGFASVEFHDFADFSNARFDHYVNLANTTFEKGVNFYGTKFPTTETPLQADQANADPDKLTDGLILDDVQFQQPANFEWQQIQDKVNTQTKETWRLLEDSFKRAGDLEGQNEAMYRRKLMEKNNGQFWQRAVNEVDFLFWGYGIRPLRLGIWLLAFYCFFTFIYWRRPEFLVGNKIKRARFWSRLIFAIKFSAQTSWKFSYGIKHARKSLFKVLTVTHSIGFKILLILFLKAISNTSPLLNELFGKLVRV